MSAKPTDVIGVVSDTLGALNGGIDLVQNVGEVASAGADLVGNLFGGDDDGGSRTMGGGSISKAGGGSAALLAGGAQGARGGNSCPVSVDQDIKQPVVDYCKAQSDAMARIADHLVTYCTLDGSFGLLLGVFLKPMYQQSRDRAFTAIGNVRSAVDALTHQFECAMVDYEDHEESTKEMLKRILAELEELKNAQNTGGSDTGGGNTGGGGGGGGWGGGGGGGWGGGGGGGYAPPPAPVFPDPTDEEPHINVSVHVDANGEVDVDVDVDGETGNVDIDVDVDADQDDNTSTGQPDSDTTDSDYPDDAGETPDDSVGDTEGSDTEGSDLTGGGAGGGGGVGGPGGTTPDEAKPINTDPIDGVIPETIAEPEPLTPEQQAERADFYDLLWREQAAKDPLGRTADQLRLAWENRESIVLDESLVKGAATFGYAEAPVIATPTVDFSIVHATRGVRA